MTHALVNIERRGRIAIVRMNRAEKRNALNVDLIGQLLDVARMLKKDEDAKIIVLTGSQDGFCAGADRGDERIFSPGKPILEHWHTTEVGSEAVKAWESLHQVTIAAIERFAVGGGFTFAMACDFRVMGRSAFVTIPEVPLGFNYGWNSIPRMINLIGPSRTKRVALLGERIEAGLAERWGLADYIAEDGQVEAFAADLAERLAALPQLPVQFTKRAVNAAANTMYDAASHADMAQILLCFKAAAEE